MGKLPTGWKAESKEHTKSTGKSVMPEASLNHPLPKSEGVKMPKMNSAPRSKAMSQPHHMITKNGK